MGTHRSGVRLLDDFDAHRAPQQPVTHPPRPLPCLPVLRVSLESEIQPNPFDRLRLTLPVQPDAGQLHVLATTLITAAGDTDPGRRYLPADLITGIAAFVSDRQENGTTHPGHAALLAQRAVLEGRVTQETGEAELAEDTLDTHLRDYIVALARRTFRKKHSVAALDYHQLPHSGEIPAITSREDRRTLARQLIDGDAAAIAAGLPPMANPSAAELQTALTDATREAEQIIPPDRELQLLVEQIRAARPRATELVQEVIDEFRHATRKLEPGTAREIMRSYGITFEALEGETPEPGDLPAVPEAPATP